MIYVVTGLDRLLPGGEELAVSEVLFESEAVLLESEASLLDSDEEVLLESEEVLSGSLDYNYLKV